MRISDFVAVGLAALCVAGASRAQGPSTPLSQEEQQKRSAAVSATLAPLVSKTAEETTEAQLKIAERPDTAERIATFKKNLFEALRRKGFTVEQAMQLTAATSIAPFTGH